MTFEPSKKQLIRDYKRRIQVIKCEYQNNGLNEDEFNVVLMDCINSVHDANQSNNSVSYKSTSNAYLIFFLKFVTLILFLYILYILILESLLNLLLCNIQDYIYPGLRLLRLASIPIIKMFPSLSELYDESCLIQNPYFYVSDLDCWVCLDVKNIDELTTIKDPINTLPPFIYKTKQNQVNSSVLINVYNQNKFIFDKDAPKILVNNHKYISTEEFFLEYKRGDNLVGNSYLWRLTRLFPVQVAKSMFPRPDIIPHLGLSTERYISIDKPGSKPYKLPDTECNYVFIIQSQGGRVIELQPTKECAKECESITVKLEAQYLLWYNWWYWKPVCREVLNNTTSISYIGSYC